MPLLVTMLLSVSSLFGPSVHLKNEAAGSGSCHPYIAVLLALHPAVRLGALD
jgi:hypothetical protein